MAFGDGGNAERADRLATRALGGDEAGGTQAAQVPRDERLREAGELNELGDGGRASGEATHHLEAVGIAEGTVHAACRLDDVTLPRKAGDGGARGGWQCGNVLCAHRSGSLYEFPLMRRRGGVAGSWIVTPRPGGVAYVARA